MDNMLDPRAIDNLVKETTKANTDSLRRIFDSKIKQSFLIEMLHRVEKTMGMDLFKYFDVSFNNDLFVTGNSATIEYDICRMIVGIHRSNSIFVDDSYRTANEKNEKYKKQLTDDVINHVKLRNYSSEFFRKKQIVLGDEFLYFPLLYKLFALSIKGTMILIEKGANQRLSYFYSLIFNKTLAALSLIESNFLDNAYPICRLIIELYFKLLLIELYPGLLEEHDKFADYDMRKTCCGEKYPEDFEEKFNNRKNQKEKNRLDFLHYGWVDFLDDYHDIVKQKPYSTNGLVAYLTEKKSYDSDYTNLMSLYRMCHTYTHGNVANSKYPLLHYFELSIMLGSIVPHVYNMLCVHTNDDSNIEGINVISAIEKDFKLLIDQYNKRSTENFESYYKPKK